MMTIIARILKQIRNDHRSMALLIMAPIFILTLLYFLLAPTDYTPKVIAYFPNEAMVSSFEDQLDITLIDDTITDPYSYIEGHEYDAYLEGSMSGIDLYFIEANTKAQLVMQGLTDSLETSNSVHVNYRFESGSDNKLESLADVFLGVLAFFFVFLFSGVSFVGERNTQTLDRMLLSPLSKASIVSGYLGGYGLLSALQSTFMVLYAKFVLKLEFNGALWLCILIMILLSFSAVSFGTLLSIFAKNQFQMIQFIPVVIVPQIFFSGLIPIDTIPYGIGNICYIFPVYYGSLALKQVMIYGYGFVDVLPQMLGLIAFTGLLFILNVTALRRAS